MDISPQSQTWDQGHHCEHIWSIWYSLAPCLDLQTLCFWHPRPLLFMDHDFLYSHIQRVTLNGILSSPLPVIVGVPQGSVFGLALFLIFINDLSDSLKKSCLSLSWWFHPLPYNLILQTNRLQPIPSLQNLMESGAGLTLRICLTILTNPMHSPYHFERTVWQTLSSTSWTNHLKRLSHSNVWPSSLAIIFFGQTIFTRWLPKPDADWASLIMQDSFKTFIRSLVEYCSPLWASGPASRFALIDAVESKGFKIIWISHDEPECLGLLHSHHRQIGCLYSTASFVVLHPLHSLSLSPPWLCPSQVSAGCKRSPRNPLLAKLLKSTLTVHLHSFAPLFFLSPVEPTSSDCLVPFFPPWLQDSCLP